MPKDMGDIVRPKMLVPKWGVIERLTRIPAAVKKSSFNAQDKPTAEQGHMNELNEGQLWQELQPREGTKKEEVAAAAPDIVVRPKPASLLGKRVRLKGRDDEDEWFHAHQDPVDPPQQKPAVTIYDSTARSAVKAVCWRITAGIVTAVSTLIFTDGNWRIALSMVGSDFASKSVTMFVGERLWNKSQVGRDANGESPMRSVIKAVAWRLFAVLNTLVVGIFFAGSVSVASKIASTDAVVKTTLMVLYERIWNRIRWGRIENTNGDGI